MGKIIVSMFVTFDGVIEDPGGSEGWKYGGWQLPLFDDVMAAEIGPLVMGADALLLGRVTYEGFAAAWPSVTDEFGAKMNSMPKFVPSRTLQDATWNATVLKGDVPDEVARLKQRPDLNTIVVMGGAQLVHTLREHNLIDEYRLWVHPVVLGSGKRLFKEGIDPTKLTLIDTKTTSTGVVLLTYTPAQSEQ
jgi:dihydrofolate reductase